MDRRFLSPGHLPRGKVLGFRGAGPGGLVLPCEKSYLCAAAGLSLPQLDLPPATSWLLPGRWPGLGPEPFSLGRFIHQVNQAAVTIQRWYRRQVQRRRVGAARLEHLLQAKREVSVGASVTPCSPRGSGPESQGSEFLGQVESKPRIARGSCLWVQHPS